MAREKMRDPAPRTHWRLSDGLNDDPEAGPDLALWDLLAEQGGDPLFEDKDAAENYRQQVDEFLAGVEQDALYQDADAASLYTEAHVVALERAAAGELTLEPSHFAAARVAAARTFGQKPIGEWRPTLTVKRHILENPPPPEPPPPTDEHGEPQ